jgi:hypothetical protein
VRVQQVQLGRAQLSESGVTGMSRSPARGEGLSGWQSHEVARGDSFPGKGWQQAFRPQGMGHDCEMAQGATMLASEHEGHE